MTRPPALPRCDHGDARIWLGDGLRVLHINRVGHQLPTAHPDLLALQAGQYTGPLGNWSGTIGELQIGTNGKLTSAGLNASITNVRNDGELLVGPSTTVSLSGISVSTGRIEIRGLPQQAAVLQLTADATFSGTGETVLVGRNNSFIGNNDNAAKTLTIAAGHTVRGSGMLGGGRSSQYASDGISVSTKGGWLRRA